MKLAILFASRVCLRKWCIGEQWRALINSAWFRKFSDVLSLCLTSNIVPRVIFNYYSIFLSEYKLVYIFILWYHHVHLTQWFWQHERYVFTVVLIVSLVKVHTCLFGRWCLAIPKTNEYYFQHVSKYSAFKPLYPSGDVLPIPQFSF